MTDTNVRRNQTTHQDDRLASPFFTARMRSARLTEGGTLTWDISGPTGTFTWSSPLYIEFPSMPWKIKINISGANPGFIGSIAVGETLYLEIPFINDGGSNVDDVHPLGTWDVGVDPVLEYAYSAIQKSTGPIPNAGVSGSQFFFIATRIENDQLVLHNDCILSDGVPGAIGSGSNAGSRTIITAPAADWEDIGILYAPNQKHLHVYVNGVYQLPARYDGAVVDGYLANANAQYREMPITGGDPADTLYGGIEWSTTPADATPDTGEIVVFLLGSGAMGPPGPPGPPGGMQDAYDNGKSIDLDYDGGTNTQDPIDLEEGLEATDINAVWPQNVKNNPRLSVFEILRTVNHPHVDARQKVAFLIDSVGNIASSGVFCYNPEGLMTFENVLLNNGPGRKDGIYYAGMDERIGSDDPTNKYIIHFIDREVLDNAGVDDPRRLQQLRQDPDVMPPAIWSGTLRGQFAVNEQGEVATGWARDFIRWHVFDILFPFQSGGDVYTTSFTLNSNVIEDSAAFVGGFATHPIDSDEYEVFFHANPTNAYVGDNPYELKLAIEKVGSTRYLRVTYGANLINYTAKIVLFFSAEYAIGASAPDEGDFT